mmetsp:Transcript_17008/g.24414  ORF Transcript_17008/g.24414 Transcript_17008/m.24414 type:complete len:97 (+) Transcript_17008:125-415(+)
MMAGQAVSRKRILPPVSRNELVEEDPREFGGDDAVGDIEDGYLRSTRKDIEIRLRRLLKILKKHPQRFSKKKSNLFRISRASSPIGFGSTGEDAWS